MLKSACAMALALAVSLFPLVGTAPLAAQEITYGTHIRPIFKTHCFHCHGEGGTLEGGLDLRLHRLIAAGGDSGVVVQAGAASESLLLQRLVDGDMPPPEVALRPTPAEIQLVEQWIALGAATGRPEPHDLDPDHYITEHERSYWAFQPVQATRPPDVHTPLADDSNAIDRFILAELEKQSLPLSPPADRRTLIRRVYFDLLGLPPAPAEVAAFVQDDAADAYPRLVDRLLNSPQYGERWGRHWLDVAGYADSEGYTEDDAPRPYAYKYRDYVVRAFNADMPMDQFIVEQLAGDELLTPPLENLSEEQAEKLVATGFLRMAPDGTGSSGVDQGLARNDVLAKTIEIVSTSLLGLTVGCAQCHNHRYDPILQRDYYALRAIFEPALNTQAWQPPAKRLLSLLTDEDRARAADIESQAQKVVEARAKRQAEYIEATFQSELAKLDSQLQEPITVARNTPEKERSPEQKSLLKKYPSVNVTASSLYLYDKKAADELQKMSDEAAAIRSTKPPEDFVRAVWEPADEPPPPTFVFYRGDHEQPREEMPPGELSVLTSATPVTLPADDPNLATTGRRLAYAKWLTSGQHPLVARVLVNRIWLNHFGRGLVPNPGDFGALGGLPTHPQLLDWLAHEFVSHDWSVKHLHRVIMNSATYRQSSQRTEAGEAVDAENSLYWRMPVRRLEAEVLRDTALAISSELNLKGYGPPVPVMADQVGQFVVGKENLNAGRPGEVIPMHGEDLRRSLYIEARRSRPLSVLAPFDLPRMEPNCTIRNVSTASPQALLMMNSEFVLARAEHFADRLRHEAGEALPDQIQLAWQLVFAEDPTEHELSEAVAFIAAQTQHFADHPPAASKPPQPPTPEREALASFCHALLSSNRLLYVD